MRLTPGKVIHPAETELSSNWHDENSLIARSHKQFSVKLQLRDEAVAYSTSGRNQ